MKKRKSFTLVEIMIVVVIIALLAAMAIPAFLEVRTRSQASAIGNNLRQLASGADQYFMMFGVSTVTSQLLIEGNAGVNSLVKTFKTVAGESYPASITSGTNLTSGTATTGTITYVFQ
jgi:prepilin-type N-terminal cleavage/methylation domain-containing protein